MKLLSFILALALAQGALSACNANNCARAVTGTRTGKMPDVTSRMKDCSSFMLITVTPATSTITATTTVTTTTTVAGMMKRQAAVLEQRQVTVTPNSVPIYASACSGTAHYSSACSCWGITAKTITASTPVTRTTVTVTATATVSVCPVGDTKCGTSCFNLDSDNNNCGRCGTVCAQGTTCQSGACASLSGTCSSYTASCFDVVNGILATNSIASPELVGYHVQGTLMGITSPSDFLAALGTNPCQMYTDPTENSYCMELLANSQFVSQLTDITNGLLTALQTCTSDFAAGGQDYQIIINEPNNATCTGQNKARRHEKQTFSVRENYDMTGSMLEAIEDYGSTMSAPLLGRPKSSGLSLTRKQLSTCSQTGTCFQTCPDCRDQQTYCGSTANVIATAVCGGLAAVTNAGVAVLAGGACGTACGPAAPLCAAFCARAAGGLSAVVVGTACAVVRNAICDPLTQRCANCNSANNGICNAGSTQCCAGETGTRCGVDCCCCPECYAPGGIDCACTAAPC